MLAAVSRILVFGVIQAILLTTMPINAAGAGTTSTTAAPTAIKSSLIIPPGGSMNKSICPSIFPLTHTACLSRSQYAIAPIGVTSKDKAAIIKLHAQLRASEPATDMQAPYWDGEVAYVAQKWAENCQFQHDTQRNIPNAYSVGQNLALGYGSWIDAIKGWYNEKLRFTYGDPNYVFSNIGHYTQLVWSSSARIGCGFSTCTNLNGKKLYVCNYAPAGNFAGRIQTPYTRGAHCAACPNKCKNSMCDCGGLVCKNGGTLNLNKCTCSCPSPFRGLPDCNLNCKGIKDEQGCGKPQPFGFPRSFCSLYSNVPQACPIMCGLCPVSGKK